MTNKKEALNKLWSTFKFKRETLVDRIILQKTIYILAKLDYPGLKDYLNDFGMYIHGPYSSLLAKDIYELELDKIGNFNLSAEEKEKIELFNELVNCTENANKKLEHYMVFELLADIIFLYTNKRVPSKEDVFKTLKEKKNYFDDPKTVYDTIDFLKCKNII